MLERNKPLLAFEFHKGTDEGFSVIQEILFKNKYRLFEINELLDGNAINCKNFIAFPSEQFDTINLTDLQTFVGGQEPILIEITQ